MAGNSILIPEFAGLDKLTTARDHSKSPQQVTTAIGPRSLWFSQQVVLGLVIVLFPLSSTQKGVWYWVMGIG